MNARGRSSQQILDDLGQRLDRAYVDPPRRRFHRPARRSPIFTVLAIVGVVGASTAAATQTVFSTAPPLPRLSRMAVELGSGSSAGIRWQLTAGRCSTPAGSFSVLLSTPFGRGR